MHTLVAEIGYYRWKNSVSPGPGPKPNKHPRRCDGVRYDPKTYVGVKKDPRTCLTWLFFGPVIRANDLFGELDLSFRPSPWNVRLSGALGLHIGHKQDENIQSLHIWGLAILHWVQWSCSRWVLSRCNKVKSIVPESHNFHTIIIVKVVLQFVQ